jgi:outer membrane biosynthesis protein TonB
MTTSPISFRQSLVASLVIHIFLLVLLSLVFQKSPFKKEVEPIIVTIDAPTAMAEGAESLPTPPTPKTQPQPLPQTKPTTATKKQEAEKIISTAKEKAKKTTTTSKPVPSTQPSSSSEESPTPAQNQSSEDDLLAKSIEQALQTSGKKQSGTSTASGSGQQGTGTDPLGDAKWKSRPRRTIFFPDIASKIRQQVPNPLMGYTVTAHIVFDSQGLAIKVDIIRSSGDPTIDSIFLSELKKIRVEAISEDRLDEITKTFKITVR